MKKRNDTTAIASLGEHDLFATMMFLGGFVLLFVLDAVGL
jgi:hypothetical protein